MKINLDDSKGAVKCSSQTVQFAGNVLSDLVNNLVVPGIQTHQSSIFHHYFLEAFIIFLLQFTAKTLQ